MAVIAAVPGASPASLAMLRGDETFPFSQTRGAALRRTASRYEAAESAFLGLVWLSQLTEGYRLSHVSCRDPCYVKCVVAHRLLLPRLATTREPRVAAPKGAALCRGLRRGGRHVCRAESADDLPSPVRKLFRTDLSHRHAQVKLHIRGRAWPRQSRLRPRALPRRRRSDTSRRWAPPSRRSAPGPPPGRPRRRRPPSSPPSRRPRCWTRGRRAARRARCPSTSEGASPPRRSPPGAPQSPRGERRVRARSLPSFPPCRRPVGSPGRARARAVLVPWEAIKDISDDRNGCFRVLADGSLEKVQLFSNTTGRPVSLMPSGW